MEKYWVSLFLCCEIYFFLLIIFIINIRKMLSFTLNILRVIINYVVVGQKVLFSSLKIFRLERLFHQIFLGRVQSIRRFWASLYLFFIYCANLTLLLRSFHIRARYHLVFYRSFRLGAARKFQLNFIRYSVLFLLVLLAWHCPILK